MSSLGEAIKEYVKRELKKALADLEEPEMIDYEPKESRFLEDMKRKNEELLMKIKSRDYSTKK